MLAPEAFLKQECENVATLLDHALRFDYGPSGSSEFYQQCQLRLAYIRKELTKLPTAKPPKVAEIASLLSKLSELIAHVERAHIGEFSWACGQSFRRHAIALCREIPPEDDEDEEDDEPDTLTKEAREKQELALKAAAEPLFFILADGGILSYRIRSWQTDLDIPLRRVFTITVPTSLRHHVLLHAVLGHEIGHAAHQLPDQGNYMDGFVTYLIENSVMKDFQKFFAWNLSGFPPLAHIADKPALQQSLVKFWATEVVCDIFGLLLMGPSFAGALRSLFDGFDSVGTAFGSRHPPQVWRFEAMARAYRHLKWDKQPERMSADLKSAFDSFTTTTLKYDDKAAHAGDVFKGGAIETLVGDMQAFFEMTEAGVAYKFPDAAMLEHLFGSLMRLRPPVGQKMDAADGGFLPAMDYRHILHAGWLAVHGKRDPAWEKHFKFLNLNRLCEQAIVQHEAVRYSTGANVGS